MREPLFLVVDLFCGAGGTTTGFTMADDYAKVIACVNHDPKAIKSHWLNHPEVTHFEEDIRTLKLEPLIKLVNQWRNRYPNALLILWASLECTNFSKAKGGQPRDADSRTLANHLPRYIKALQPDYIEIENVVEFMSWGPMNEYGKPISRRNGQDWLRWRNTICSHGYRDEWKEMNSADYGAYTSRNRLFGIFAKDNLPIVFPEPTHSKTPTKFSMFGKDLQQWKAVKDVLDFADEGQSILTRKKELCDKTLNVIYKGLIKSLKEGNNSFLFKYYGNGDNLNSINDPAGTITTKDRFAKVSFIFRNYKSGYTTSVNEPIGTIPTNPKAYLVSYVYNPSHGGHTTSTDAPCPVIVASQNKAPLSLIKVLMDENGIVDIKKRMLRVAELLKIQGFPDQYKLEGNQSDQKKFIGNSVVPHVVKAWTLALADRIIDETKYKVA
jgi:DNA (cytosine-5)-methyltransferase 1